MSDWVDDAAWDLVIGSLGGGLLFLLALGYLLVLAQLPAPQQVEEHQGQCAWDD